ncbi:RHS repeat domain-containing protein [Pseudomonas sp. Ant30-3]|uniref:RHS repeat domain-containing protein n=1 Tax=Pseudomonas sp. Ant30-3 TaxID=1488328 RepID=UPI00048F2DEB|nr:RHS repeat-associated core domain-containing protein [Pseudomonas sp. Ant30-3]
MNAHSHTPTLTAMEPRSLAIRSVAYCRRPDNAVIESRITRQIFDAQGRMAETWDPRLWGTAPKPNLSTVHGLSGQPLLTDSVDAGWQLSLLDQAGSLCSFRDARGSQRHIDYDDQQRPITVAEQVAGEPSRVLERLAYGGSDPAFTLHNQCGRLIRHDNPASTQFVVDYGLTGSVLIENCRFLTDLGIPDWPLQLEDRDRLLEKQPFVTCYAFNPSGELQRLTDAMGNERTFGYDVAGKLREAGLLLDGPGNPQRLISDIHYNAHDQIESETAGNGVVTRADYSADNGRLIRLISQFGDQKPQQDLHYRYDPVGNIVELEDQSQPVSHFNNQRIDPINRYRYDSLYQLIEASGWEVSQPSHGPALPDLLPIPLDPTQRRNYTQRFEYDPAGNLITRHHSGAPGFSMFTSARSNRSLAQREDGSLPGEAQIDSGFDACGNQRELQRGQTMIWDGRNQLSRVTLVKRANEPDDYECYTYDRPGHRLRKVHVSQANNQTLRTEVRYLPGLEVHRQADGEERHVISVDAGRCSIRALHWPDGAHTDQLRYSVSDHLGSSTLELDHEAGVLTREHYYTFGGTACWAGKSALAAKYKTHRYSGKERDATGLHYYGYRYYAPWLQLWLSPDPAGLVNGLNLFTFVSNSPVNRKDVDGRWYEGENDGFESNIPVGAVIVARGLTQLQTEQRAIVKAELLEAERFFSGAQEALKSNFAESETIMQQYFGPAYRDVVGKVFDAWTRGQKMAKEYQGAWGDGKFLAYRGNPKYQAHISTEDFYGRVALNTHHIKAGSLSMILGHEILHLNRVNRFSNIGAGALDHFYLSSNTSRLSPPRTQFDIPEQGVSEIIMQGGMVVEYMNDFTLDHESFISAVGEHFGRVNSGIDVDTAVYFFNRSPDLRAKMASENADSLVFAAHSMNQLYQARLADSQLFSGLLSS